MVSICYWDEGQPLLKASWIALIIPTIWANLLALLLRSSPSRCLTGIMSLNLRCSVKVRDGAERGSVTCLWSLGELNHRVTFWMHQIFTVGWGAGKGCQGTARVLNKHVNKDLRTVSRPSDVLTSALLFSRKLFREGHGWESLGEHSRSCGF